MVLPFVEALSYTKPVSAVPFKIEETQSPHPKQKSTKPQAQALPTQRHRGLWLSQYSFLTNQQ